MGEYGWMDEVGVTPGQASVTFEYCVLEALQTVGPMDWKDLKEYFSDIVTHYERESIDEKIELYRSVLSTDPDRFALKLQGYDEEELDRRLEFELTKYWQVLRRQIDSEDKETLLDIVAKNMRMRGNVLIEADKGEFSITERGREQLKDYKEGKGWKSAIEDVKRTHKLTDFMVAYGTYDYDLDAENQHTKRRWKKLF